MASGSGWSRRAGDYGTYATAAGRRLRSRRPRAGPGAALARLASSIWDSSRLVRQTLVAGAVLLVALGLLKAPYDFLAGARAYLVHYLTTDLDLQAAARQVFSPNLREGLAEGWRILPELWERLRGQPSTPGETTFILPTQGTITSGFGYRADPVTGEVAFHTGIDIAAEEGTPFVAALDGTVLSVDENATYGRFVEVDHGRGLVTLYAHAQTITVKAGDQVKQGDTLGTVGMTGKATTPHLHFEVILAGQPTDPLKMKGLGGTE